MYELFIFLGIEIMQNYINCVISNSYLMICMYVRNANKTARTKKVFSANLDKNGYNLELMKNVFI